MREFQLVLLHAVKLRAVFQTKSAFPSFSKNCLSYFHKSLGVYKFKCRCEAVYIGPTNQRLETRITQHVPVYLRSSSQSRKWRTTQAVHDSSIGQHLLENPDSAAEYKGSFSILHSARSVYYLSPRGYAYQIPLAKPMQTKRAFHAFFKFDRETLFLELHNFLFFYSWTYLQLKFILIAFRLSLLICCC